PRPRRGVRGPRRLLLRERQAALPQTAHPDRWRWRYGGGLVPESEGLGGRDHPDPPPRPVPRPRGEHGGPAAERHPDPHLLGAEARLWRRPGAGRNDLREPYRRGARA